MMKTVILVLALGGLLVAALAVTLFLWLDLGEVDIGIHGMIAMGLGIVLTLGLGVGLMALVFYSSRHGYDDTDRKP